MFNHNSFSDPFNWLYNVSVSRLEEAFADALEEIGLKKAPLQYGISYVPGRSVNASVWHLEPSGCKVNIYASAPVLIYMACMQYAASCNLHTGFPLMDDGKLLVLNHKETICTKLDKSIKDESEVTAILNAFAENNYTNTALGLFLCEIALKFIAMHECMHVILGHTKFLQEKYSMRIFSEFTQSRKLRLTPSFSQMLEFIADRHTVRGIIVRLLKNDFDDFYNDNLLKDIRIDKKAYLLRCLVNTFCILFHLFPRNSRSIFTSELTHPYPYIRARWLCIELMQELDNKIPDFYEPLVSMTTAAAHLASNFELPGNWQKAMAEDFNSLTGKSFSDEAYRNVVNDATKWQTKIWKKYAPQYL